MLGTLSDQDTTHTHNGEMEHSFDCIGFTVVSTSTTAIYSIVLNTTGTTGTTGILL